ncbi:hypothetical protein [Oceanicella actignis]|uniref:Phage protein, HK97 gp10 family n=1 Tax=Oceanicella actignis TaxID=1189325 RepID=A0A1M7U1T1_9RHOB|nr:hypothetical protein [Oceanicella actignis]SES76372.1 hypothetical protein SAMN04488119_101391 [Oceanicella actignis]SHN76991.1 hypothetical protein SAMN05216200_11431 [Oceanicella actignis]
MEISFQHNIAQVERGLSDFARTQVPFAASLALNATAQDVKRNAEKGLVRKLDRPTKFTLRAYALRRASKRRLAAAVFAKDLQAAYLRFQETGGEREPKRRAIVVPVGIRLNKHGNMPRGSIKRHLAKPRVFSGDPKGPRPGGIYERRPDGRGLRLLAAYTPRARYRPRLGFRRGAALTAQARMARHFEAALARAIRTAKR